MDGYDCLVLGDICGGVGRMGRESSPGLCCEFCGKVGANIDDDTVT